MRKTTVERFPLTPREEEAEKECRANYRPLQSLPKPVRVNRVKRRPVWVEQFPLTDREREAENELDTQKLGVALPF